MDMAWLFNLTKKNRSSTFGAYESQTTHKDVSSSSQRHNLIVSPMRSVDSGVGVFGRKRSSTWHGADLQVNQLASEENLSPKCVTAPSLKDIFCKIVTEELSKHLENETDLKSSQEFVEKSAMIAKLISTKARKVVGHDTKVVSSVFIGEIREDGIEIASQCLYDPTQDSFATGNFKSAHIFAVGMLFATSFEEPCKFE